jgi:ABC-type amino acid transport substrate-binding protein
MILTFSLTLLGLLVVSVYTANLASFLVVQRQPTYRVETIRQAVLVGAPICVRDKVDAQEYINDKYPTAILRSQPTEADVYLALQAKECEVAAVPLSEFRIYERDAEVNKGCSLEWHGRVELFVPAGFASDVDTGKLLLFGNWIYGLLSRHLTFLFVYL